MKFKKIGSLFFNWVSNLGRNSNQDSDNGAVNSLCQEFLARKNRCRKIYAVSINSLMPVLTLLFTFGTQSLYADGVNLPYSQKFDDTLPQAGWEYNSSGFGKIEVADGALLMTGVMRGSYVTNRAILSVDLSTTPVPYLRYRTTRYGDEDHDMPSSFNGSSTGDGVAISVDGINWHRIDALDNVPNRTFAAKNFNLATFARSRNLTLGSDVRILFQQHDNYPLPLDGRAFDDITIDGGLITPRAPPPTFSFTSGPTSDLSAFPIGYWSIGSVDYADNDPQNRLSIDTNHFVQGGSSIQFNSGSGFPVVAAFPTTRNANWDLRGSSTLRFDLFVRTRQSNTNLQRGPEISLISGGQSRYVYKPADMRRMFGDLREQWTTIEIPLEGNADWMRAKQGDARMQDIDAIEILLDVEGYGLDFWIDNVRFESGVRTKLPSLQASDLDITYIERTPKHERYDIEYDNDLPVRVKNMPKLWPGIRERVTWTAHIANRGRVRSSTFEVQWVVNGWTLQKTRHAALEPNSKLQVDFPYAWQGRRDNITARVIPDYKEERTTRNNSLAIMTDSLTYAFYVEKTTCAMLNTVPNRHGSMSCEGWLSALIKDINQRFTISKYDFAPNGVSQRVRIDKIEVVPDGSLASGNPVDLTVDGSWGFQAKFRAEYRNHNVLPNEGLTHELIHQLGVIDTYHFNIDANNNGVNGVAYRQPYESLMGGSSEPTTFAVQMLGPHSVYGLNSTQGYRRGYYGDYLLSLPRTTRVKLVSASNRPLANTQIKFYQTKDSKLEGGPKFTLRTDNSGVAVLPNYAITTPGNRTKTGHMLTANPFGDLSVVGTNGVFLVEFVHNGVRQYKTITVAELNLAYARGMTGVYTHTVRSSQ